MTLNSLQSNVCTGRIAALRCLTGMLLVLFGVVARSTGQTVVVGSSSSNIATVQIPISGTIGEIDVLTQGAQNKDFQYASGGSCSVGTAYTAGQSCTVDYTFAPTRAGQRLGAIVLRTASTGTTLGTTPIAGLAIGPLATIPGTTGRMVGSGFQGPNGVAVDGNGDVFVGDATAGRVYEIVAGTKGNAPGVVNANSTVVTVGSGFENPSGVAVDGAGDVFVADINLRAVLEVLAGTGGNPTGVVSANSTVVPVATGFSEPISVAVDVSGDVFVADLSAFQVIEVLAGTGGNPAGTVSTSSSRVVVGNGYGTPYGIALDSSGNVFFTDPSNYEVWEVVAGTGGNPAGTFSAASTVFAVGSGWSQPTGVTVDAAGNVFVADYKDGVYEIQAGTGGNPAGAVSAQSTVIPVGSGFISPSNVALDGLGHIYIADSSNRKVDEVDLFMPLGISPTNIPSSIDVGNIYANQQFHGSGGSGSSTVALSGGSVPPGMTFTNIGQNSTAVLAGTPTKPGSYTFTVTASDSTADMVVSQSYTITVTTPQYTLTPGSFSIATAGTAYSQSFSIVGNPPGYTLTMTNAAGLPAGLTYTASGETVTISGTPANVPAFTDCGPFNFNLTDQYGDVETLGPIALFLYPAPLASFTGSTTPAAPLYTDQVTLTLAGTGNHSATPTGILSLSLDGGAAKNYPLANGTVVLPLGRLVPGSHTLDYTYSGDSQYPATDQTYSFTVAYPAYYLTGTVSGVLPSAGYYDVIDPYDNIYIADTNVNTIRKYDPSGNLTVVPTTGLNQPRAMVFDGVGNLYISDSANNRIVVLSPNGAQTVLPGLTVNFPTGIAFDRTYQNLWIADQNNDQVVEYNMSSQTVTSTVTGFYNVPDAVAVAASGTVYVGTVGNYASGGIYTFTPGATTAAELPYPQLHGVGCLVFDKFGNLYVSDRNGNNLFRLDSSGNMTQLATQISNAGIALDSQSNIWLANGGLSKFVPGPAGYAGVSNSYEGAYGGTFGGVFRAYFHSPTGTTLAALAVPANDAYQAPFGFTASDSFAFSDLARGPIYPGLQTGSVTATFSDGTVLKVPLYGSAYNTQLAISPGVVSQTTTNATSYGGATTDANGNVYFADTAANKVYEVFQGIVTPIPFTGLNAPTQLAVDGNGSVYVLDSGTSRILKYNNTPTVATNTTTVAFDLSAQSALASLTAFALDGATDLYLAGTNNNGQGNSYGNGRIQELNALGTYSTFSAGLVAVPTALAFDTNSQLYSGDATGLLTKFTKVGAPGALATGLGTITSMAIEPSGTVYLTTAGSAALSVVSPQGAISSYTIAGVTNAVVMTEDKPGTLTVADGASGLLITDVRDPSLLSPNANQTVNVGFNFPTTVVGSSSPVQSYTLTNIGTTEDAYGASGLTLQGLPGLNDFPQAPSTTCVTGTTNLVAGASCVLAFTFSPTTPGNDNETGYIQYSTPHASSGYSLLGPTFTGTAITTATTPGAPTIGTAIAGNAAASISFTAPASNGGSTITSYTVTSSPGGITATATSSPIVVTGLTNGTAYTFTVTATNANGTSPASAPSNSVTPLATTPGAPIIGTATPGNASASISFTAPASNGGSTITSYTVTSSPGGITATATSSPIVVTGLTNGTTYTFTVTATNAYGTSPASAPSNSITPVGPTPPAVVDVVVMHKSAPLSVFPTTGSSAVTGSPGGGIGAAIDSSGSILSIDPAGTSLTKFTNAGAFFGNLSGGGLNAATALAVDGNSNVWVANGNGTLSVFTSSGTPVSTIPVAAAGNISQPASVNIDASGSVWVANTGNNTVTEIVGAAAPAPVIVTGVINATPGTKP